MCRITPNAAKFEFVNSLKTYVYCIKRHVKTIKIYYNLIYMIFYYINIKILLNLYILNNFHNYIVNKICLAIVILINIHLN